MTSEKFDQKKYWNTIIIGGGQAGLAAGYYLKKKGEDFLILDSGDRIGDSWRKRWDSLCLFTPSQYDGLPGFPFPSSHGSFPSKDKVADYLEDYVKHFELPVATGIKVSRLKAGSRGFEVSTSGGQYTASSVVVATGTNPVPKIPEFSARLNAGIYQIHSAKYVNPESLPPGDVLVVGAGTSGMEIAIEISRYRHTIISGNPTFHIPDPVFKYAGRLYWWFANNVLTVKTPIGKKARHHILHSGAPLIRVSEDDLNNARVKRLPKVMGINNGYPLLEDGRTVQPSVIIWATGYKPDFSWIYPVITDETGWPETDRGVSTVVDSLYFVGMPFQYGLTSGLIGGVGRDAAYISQKMSKKQVPERKQQRQIKNKIHTYYEIHPSGL